MGLLRPSWWLSRMLLGLVIGWAIGLVWWTGLMISFGPSAQVSYSGGERIEQPVTVGSRLIYGPVMACPWALVGLVVGAINVWAPGSRVPINALLGIVAGGLFCVLTGPYDGWLALTMPLYCSLGALVGAVKGAMSEGSRPLQP